MTRPNPNKPRLRDGVFGLLVTMLAFYGLLWGYDAALRPWFLRLLSVAEHASIFVQVGAVVAVFALLQRLRERENKRPVDRFISVLSIVLTSALTFALMLTIGSGDAALAHFFVLLPYLWLLLALLGLARVATHRSKLITRAAQGLAYMVMFFSTFWAGMAGLFWPEWLPWIFLTLALGVGALWFLFAIPTSSDECDDEPEWAFNAFRTHVRAVFLAGFALALFATADQHLATLSTCEDAELACWARTLGEEIAAPLPLD